MEKMIKQFSILFLVLFCTNQIWAQRTGYRTSNPPKVVIGIVVENMRPDYIDRYWNKFGNDGFRKLYTNGAVVTNMKISQHVQNYASGTATLFTGVYPSGHGIIDDVWYDRLRIREVGAVADDYYFTVGADSKSGNASPKRLMASTVGDNLKLFSMNKSKVYSIAMNAESAILSAGHAADAAWWFDPVSGRMISSSFYVSTFPEWARDFNMVSQGDRYSGRNWVTLHPESYYTESLPDNHYLEKGYGDKANTFPHSLNRHVRRAESFNPIKTTPFANTIIREFTTTLLENEPVGEDNIPDLVTVVFSSMDYEHGSFGPASLEMQDIYLRLDQEIAELINFAEKRYGKDNTVFFLTANTSASYPVNYLKEVFSMPVGDFQPESAFALLNSFLNITYGEAKWIEHLSGQQVYLDHKLIEKSKVDLIDMRNQIADFLTQFEGVRVALPAQILEQGGSDNSALANLYRSYMINRSGDVLYVLSEGWQPVYKFKRVNYTDQSHIPAVFYGAGIKPSIISSPYNAIDLAPTLSEILHISVPDKSRGRVIEGI
jgi:predicted AlkP superfamily pyrophosphatase or phosphodiesterase